MTRSSISMSDKVFDLICGKINESYPNACILFIDEIKNQELEDAYNEHKSNVINKHVEKLSKTSEPPIVKKRAKPIVKKIVKASPVLQTPAELQVFHGTHANNINSIIINGFDPSKNRVSAYGIGSYFTKNPSYSFNYMKSADINDISYMFVANIFIGKVKYNSSEDDGDTYVDNVRTPTIFCMPLKEQTLPKYLVAFHKNAV
jgi:hypothetical protein